MLKSMWKKRILYVFIILSLSACIDKNMHRNDVRIFKYNEAAGISSSDPAFARDQATMWCVSQLYNGLLQLDADLQLHGCIAKSWHISDDKCTYTFSLRNDIYFHNDPCFTTQRKLSAYDVVYSFERLLDSATASPGAWVFRNKVRNVHPFVAVNDSTFQLHLIKPYPLLLRLLSMPYTYIVPKEAVSYYGRAFAFHPVGTGAFIFKDWDEGNALYLRKNTAYFEKDSLGALPHIDGVKITFIASKKTELLEFKKGNLSMVNDLNAFTLQEIQDDKGEILPEWKQRANCIKIPFAKTEYIGFNMNDSVYKPELRLALNYCFDRSKITTFLRNYTGIPARSGIIPPCIPGYDSAVSNGFTYNTTKAKQYVNAYVKKYGSIPTITLYTNENNKEYAQYIAREATNIGIPVKTELVPSSLLREWMSQGKVSFFRASWIADYPDAESFLSLFYSKNAAPPNYTRYSSPLYDYWYEKALTETNDSLRFSIYSKLEGIMLADAPIIPVFYEHIVRLQQKNIKQLPYDAMNNLQLKYVYIE